MNQNRICCRIFPLILFLISIFISAGIWYFEESVRQFTFLKNPGEIVNFLGTALFVSVLPIAIFYLSSESKKFDKHSKKLALLGFFPALVFMLLMAV